MVDYVKRGNVWMWIISISCMVLMLVGCCYSGYGKYKGKKRREWCADGAWLKKQCTKGFLGKSFFQCRYQRFDRNSDPCMGFGYVTTISLLLVYSSL